jgi:hypothetical protein
MSEEERRDNLGNTNPEDNRQPGAGGGEQPASYLLTNEPIDRPGARSGFEAGDTEFHVGVHPDTTGEPQVDGGEAPQTIADKLVYARGQLGDDVFVLEEGSEIFNTSGLRVVLLTPAAVRLENGSPDPATNDQRFASFLFGSDRNWGLNIKQLERPYDRARNVALPLMCEAHGEDLEWEAYGRERQCPKCAQEALAAAAEVQPAQPAPAEGQTEASPILPSEPLKAGDVVVCTIPDSLHAGIEMTATEVDERFGIAICTWTDETGGHTKAFGLNVLRRATEPTEHPNTPAAFTTGRAAGQPLTQSEAAIRDEDERQAAREREEGLRRGSILPEG